MSGARGQSSHAGHSGTASEEAERAARIRRSAWTLAVFAVVFYVGFIVWNAIRGPIGG